LEALSEMERDAEACPAAVGWKLTEALQLAPPAIIELHVLDSENRAALVPVISSPLMASGAAPVFVMVTVCAVP